MSASKSIATNVIVVWFSVKILANFILHSSSLSIEFQSILGIHVIRIEFEFVKTIINHSSMSCLSKPRYVPNAIRLIASVLSFAGLSR